MSGQKGRDILLKIADPGGTFLTVAGLRAQRFQLSAGAIDATSADSEDAWRELLSGAGMKSARVTGRGVFKDAASDARLRSAFFASEALNSKLILPHFGALTGLFLITALSWSGAYDGEAEFELTLESAGALAFEAAS